MDHFHRIKYIYKVVHIYSSMKAHVPVQIQCTLKLYAQHINFIDVIHFFQMHLTKLFMQNITFC